MSTSDGQRANPLPAIRILDPWVAERIAAGEVIERPASVVKELVENALDAGATEIAVRLEEGGKTLIEILDNGRGMSADELKLCVLRHATSKIREVADLETLTSLGFRGEALPSIVATGELAILSRRAEEASASEWRDGKTEVVTFGQFLGSAHGTRMQVSGLFAQIPARLKFLKSASTEVSYVREWLERLALTRPSVSFQLQSGEKTLLRLRAESEAERVRALLSDGNDYEIAAIEKNDPSGISVRAYWLQGLSSPQTRKLVQIVNHRAVRDRLIQQAMLAPFKQVSLPGQFPAVALYLSVPPDTLDVNVHPAKTELRFLNSSLLFKVISQTLGELIATHGATGYAPGKSSGTHWTGNAAELEKQNSFFRSPSAFFAQAGEPGARSYPKSTLSAQLVEEPAAISASGTASYAPNSPRPGDSDSSASGLSASRLSGAEAPAELPPSPALLESHHPFLPARFAGIFFNTYLAYDLGTELALIDQHAAHERIRFETLKNRAIGGAALQPSQQLLLPVGVRFPLESRPRFEARLPWLEKMGFEAELFGEDQALFRAVPAEWGVANLSLRLSALIERVLNVEEGESPGNLVLDERLFEKLASEACHSAVRAGDRLTAAQAQNLVNALFECEHPWNCPHGRPCVARIPKHRFEEWFQRKL